VGDIRPQNLGSSSWTSKGGTKPAPFDIILRLCGGTVWQGHSAMRISVSSWATTEDDVEKSLEAMLRIAAEVRRAS